MPVHEMIPTAGEANLFSSASAVAECSTLRWSFEPEMVQTFVQRGLPTMDTNLIVPSMPWLQMEDGSPADRPADSVAKSTFNRGKQIMSYYANLLMTYEWMVGLPEDLGPEWRVLARPEGKRCLIIASRFASQRFCLTNFVLNEYKACSSAVSAIHVIYYAVLGLDQHPPPCGLAAAKQL